MSLICEDRAHKTCLDRLIDRHQPLERVQPPSNHKTFDRRCGADAVTGLVQTWGIRRDSPPTGHNSQYVAVFPEQELVIVRLGLSANQQVDGAGELFGGVLGALSMP